MTVPGWLLEMSREMRRQDAYATSWPMYEVREEGTRGGSPVEVFFTEEAARAYIERERHNLQSPWMWVSSQCRNPQMRALHDWILSLTEGEGG